MCKQVFYSLFLLFSIQLKAQTYNIELEKVKTVRGLTAILRNNLADSVCTLVGYNLLVMPVQGNPYQIKTIGKGIAAANLKDKLTQLEVGDIMQFTNVFIQCGSENTTREIVKVTLILR
jgi:hypothetical protein